MANASCSKARQKASRNKCINRRINVPRVFRRGMVCNWEVRSSSRSGNLWGLAAIVYGKHKTRGGYMKTAPFGSCKLLGCEFLGLAFVPHKLKRALGFFVRLRDFFLHLGGRFFHFWREADVAVVFHAGAGRNEASHDDVLFQSAQVIDLAVDGSFGQDSSRLLERGCGDERISRERSLGDAEEQRPAGCRTSTLCDHALILFRESELVDLLFEQELGVAGVFHLAPTHHLTNDYFDVLVADVDALQPVNFLDFVYQVRLQFLFSQHGQDVVGVERAVHERFAGLDALAFLHVDVNAARNRVLFFGAVVGDDIHLALSLRDLAEFNRAIDFADDCSFMRLAGFEQLDHAWQTTGDVFRLGSLARDLSQHVAWESGVAVLNH